MGRCYVVPECVGIGAVGDDLVVVVLLLLPAGCKRSGLQTKLQGVSLSLVHVLAQIKSFWDNIQTLFFKCDANVM